MSNDDRPVVGVIDAVVVGGGLSVTMARSEALMAHSARGEMRLAAAGNAPGGAP